LSGALREVACGLHKGFAEVDAGDAAAIGRREKARWTADARAGIEDRLIGRYPGEPGEFSGSGKTAGMKLVERPQLLGRKLPLSNAPPSRSRDNGHARHRVHLSLQNRLQLGAASALP
jgi:hypothetical protein